jgi:hypothetical protein
MKIFQGVSRTSIGSHQCVHTDLGHPNEIKGICLKSEMTPNKEETWTRPRVACGPVTRVSTEKLSTWLVT